MDKSFFWDKLAERYSKQPVADEAAYQHKLKITREYFRPDMEILEFGCGTGSTAIAHAPFVKHIHAIDISSNMLKIARDKTEQENIENVTFEHATIESVCVPDKSLDAVLGFSILHLLKDKKTAIGRVQKMLKPGGIFVSSTICIGDSMQLIKVVAPIGRLFGLVLKVFTAQDLQQCITAAGFNISHQWQPPGKGRPVFIVAIKSA